MVIKMEDVSLVRQGQAILSHINWQVDKGQVWAVLGLNGAGKSTLLRLILAEFWQTAGQVEILGTRFGQGDIPALRQKIGVVGSFIAERFPRGMKTEEIVLTGKYKSSILYTAYGEHELDEARQMMQSLGAGSLLGRKYESLSQGERQTVLIARSLMENPDILILDEATSGLDLFAREKVLALVERIAQSDQAPTILYVTHHAEEITASMTHLLLLKEGKVVAQGEKDQVFSPAILSDFYGCPVSLVELGDDRYFVKTEVGHV